MFKVLLRDHILSTAGDALRTCCFHRSSNVLGSDQSSFANIFTNFMMSSIFSLGELHKNQTNASIRNIYIYNTTSNFTITVWLIFSKVDYLRKHILHLAFPLKDNIFSTFHLIQVANTL
jgi:hypothetical protein